MFVFLFHTHIYLPPEVLRGNESNEREGYLRIMDTRRDLQWEIRRALNITTHRSPFRERGSAGIVHGNFDNVMTGPDPEGRYSGVRDILNRIPGRNRLAEFRMACQQVHFANDISLPQQDMRAGLSEEARRQDQTRVRAELEARGRRLYTYFNRLNEADLRRQAPECGIEEKGRTKAQVITDLVNFFQDSGRCHNRLPLFYATNWYPVSLAPSNYEGTVIVDAGDQPLNMETILARLGQTSEESARGFLEFVRDLHGGPVTVYDLGDLKQSDFSGKPEYWDLLQKIKLR